MERRLRMKNLCILTLIIVFNSHIARAEALCISDIVDTYHQPRTGVTMQNDNAIFDDNAPITIPLTYDLAERLNLRSGVELDAPIGAVSIYKNGRILYDGKDISTTLKNDCTNGTSTKITEE
jgi:hypothetical protein